MNKSEMYPELGKINLIRAERNHQWREFLQLNNEHEARREIPEMNETVLDARQKLNSKLMRWGELNNFLNKWQFYYQAILNIELDRVYHEITEAGACEPDSSFIQEYAETILKIHETYKSKEATNDNSK
jgi:hypothetical protein